MLKRLIVLVILATAVVAGCTGVQASADVVKIAVLDVERVRQDAAAVKAIRAQLNRYLDAYRVDTQKEEQDIRAAQEELARKRPKLSQDDYAEERKKVENTLAEAQARVQRRRQALERVNLEAMREVQQTLQAIVSEVATERSLTLVVRKDFAVYASPSIEITDEVLRMLDQRLPTVQISEPEG